jgi:Rps23 Pro-64 3,4-dihydroxylase Tpa1-like proline 4-hydroxylase
MKTLPHYNIIDYLKQLLSSNELALKFKNEAPIPLIVLDNFLPIKTAKDLETELDSIPKQEWKQFTRRGSYMEEYNKLFNVPVASNFVNQMHSSEVITLLEKLTGIDGIIPDPHLIGAGYSKSYRNDSLKIHTDFNWNESIKAHRALSLIVYLNSKWEDHYGGNLQFKDNCNEHVIQSISPLFNRAVIWKHDKLGFHGYPDPLNCPEDTYRKTIRLFFYTSKSSYNLADLPHRSLYWYNNKEHIPYDVRTEK